MELVSTLHCTHGLDYSSPLNNNKKKKPKVTEVRAEQEEGNFSSCHLQSWIAPTLTFILCLSLPSNKPEYFCIWMIFQVGLESGARQRQVLVQDPISDKYKRSLDSWRSWQQPEDDWREIFWCDCGSVVSWLWIFLQRLIILPHSQTERAHNVVTEYQF